MELYNQIVHHRGVRDLRDLYREKIESKRPLLKADRIATFGITHCEFSGTPFNSLSEVEFAHIESVVTAPFRALDITNGVIILKAIHRELTSQGIHDSAEMFKFCRTNNYRTDWADRL
jgi:hypothetical protein